MGSNRFQSTDAWIFLSINNIEGGTPLEDLVAKADWINHAIPSEEEVTGAINRLSKANLVYVENGIFFFTATGKEIYEYIHSQKGSMLALWDKLEKHLNMSTFPSIEVDEFRLAPGQLQAAYKIHKKRFEKAYHENRPKQKKGGWS